MQHRHLTHSDYSLAAVDDVIARGVWSDWVALRQALLGSPQVREKVQRVCSAHIAEPFAQRYHFWMHYANEHSHGHSQAAASA
jgi:hypothetical protein